MIHKKIKITLLVLVISALVFRIILLASTYNHQGSGGVTAVSIGVAEGLAAGKGFSLRAASGYTPDKYELPGYPTFLGLHIAIFGTEKGMWVARVIQIILSSLSVLLCFSIGKRLFNETIGVLFAGFWAFYFPEALMSTYILHDSLMPVFALAATYFFVYGVTEKIQWYFYGSAVVMGLANTIRSDLILLPIFFCCVYLLWDLRKWQQIFKTFIIMGIIISMFLIPWGIRNYLQFNKFSITRSVFWQAVWEGWGEFQNPFGAVLDDTITAEQVKNEFGITDGTSDAFQQALKTKVLKAFQKNPGWYFRMLPKRLFTMVAIGGGAHGHEIFTRNPIYNYASSYKLSHPDKTIFDYISFLTKTPYELLVRIGPIAFRGIILFFAVLGFWLWRKAWKKMLLVVSVFAYGTFAHLPIYWEPRYLVPTEFPILLLAALFLAYLSKRGRIAAKIT